jgi:ParB-like chromosome segregation protein Spo0J
LNAELNDIALSELREHPDNPRLGLREDVVFQLVSQINSGGFGSEHAILVRPLDGAFQIISGHHRVEAARQCGLLYLPCWVRDMDDDEAFMQLVMSNAQGELSSLEIGIHVLKAVPLEQGKRGGGLAAYAERTARGEDALRQYRSAAAVWKELPDTCREVADKHRHLYEVSKAPRENWTQLVEKLVANSWTVQQTADAVRKIVDAEREKLAEAERIAQEEAEAKAFIEENAPELAAQVGGDTISTFAEAQAIWEKRNREEAKRRQEEKRKQQEKAEAELANQQQLARAFGTAILHFDNYQEPNFRANILKAFNRCQDVLTPTQRGAATPENIRAIAGWITTFANEMEK